MMARDEAYKILSNGLVNAPSEHEWCMAFKMAMEDLKQKSILFDKMKAEIEELDGKYVTGDYGIYGENCPKYVRLWEVLQIIDKYSAESKGEK